MAIEQDNCPLDKIIKLHRIYCC